MTRGRVLLSLFVALLLLNSAAHAVNVVPPPGHPMAGWHWPWVMPQSPGPPIPILPGWVQFDPNVQFGTSVSLPAGYVSWEHWTVTRFWFHRDTTWADVMAQPWR